MIGIGMRPGKAGCRFRSPPWTRSTPAWLDLDAQLEPGHLARLVDQGVERLDLTSLLKSFSGRGTKAVPPDLMLKIVLFEIRRGRTKPAQWYQDTKENIALQWLGLGIRPARSVWYAFAFRIGPFLDGWNQELLAQAQENGLVSGQRVALDGTSVEANASRHHLLNHEQVQQRCQVLDAAVQADAAGQEPTELPYWMAQTTATRRRQQEQYREARDQLNQRLADNRQRIPSQRPKEKDVRISVTDPQAALGRDKLKVYRPLYNAQYVRDIDSPFIVGYDTFAQTSDAGTLLPMLQRTQQLLGRLPLTMLVDSGYVTAVDLADAQKQNVDLYGPWKENDRTARAASPPKQWGKDKFVWDETARAYRCPEGQALVFKGVRSRHREERLELYRADAATCAACPQKGHCCPKARTGRNLARSEHEELIEAHREKMGTPEAKDLYKRRRETVEPTIGDAKENRDYRRVNGRGLDKAKGQTALTVLVHNICAFVKGLCGIGRSKEKT
jgi:transposase